MIGFKLSGSLHTVHTENLGLVGLTFEFNGDNQSAKCIFE